MSVPILLGANPKTANPSAWIPIRFDRWAIVINSIVDSKLMLHFNSPTISPFDLSNLNGKVFDGPTQVRIEFLERGSEKNISIFATELP